MSIYMKNRTIGRTGMTPAAWLLRQQSFLAREVLTGSSEAVAAPRRQQTENATIHVTFGSS